MLLPRMALEHLLGLPISRPQLALGGCILRDCVGMPRQCPAGKEQKWIAMPCLEVEAVKNRQLSVKDRSDNGGGLWDALAHAREQRSPIRVSVHPAAGKTR